MKKGSKLSEEHKRKIGLAGRGRVHSEETKLKIGLGNKGKVVSLQSRMKMSNSQKGVSRNVGESNPNWHGEKVLYRGLHQWVTYHKKRLNLCERCKTEGLTHFANISQRYLRDIDDYIELCVSCHRNYDLGKISLDTDGKQYPTEF